MTAVNQRILQPGERIRVLIVDDSVVIRRLVTQALEQDPIIEVVGVASNGAIGLQRIPQLSPDVISLDIEMPGMDGLEMLRCIRRDFPKLRVIMFSTLTERGAAKTFEALSLGADDYVAKVSNEGSLDRSLNRLRDEMLPKIKQFFRLPSQDWNAVRQELKQATAALPARPQAPVARSNSNPRPKVLVIGVSTGGPAALEVLLPALPANFPLPVMIVQHMPELFTSLFAERLNGRCRLPVREAAEGESVRPGSIYIARGNWHLEVLASPRGASHNSLHLSQGPLENHCRPAVDVLFRSAAAVYGSGVLAVVLTGMGSDGMNGSRFIRAQGGSVLAQDQQSSAVWGMPGSVVNAGLAHKVLPLNAIASEILRLAGRTHNEARELRESVV